MTLWWILHHLIKYIKNCWVRLLSNYNIKYICTIYTRLDTCLMSISRFSLRDKVTLRLLKLYLIADVVEWYRVLDIRLSDWCCSVSMVWVQTPLRRGALDTTLCDTVCQWLVTGWWISQGTFVLSNTKFHFVFQVKYVS